MILLPIILASLGCAMAFELTPVHEWNYFDYRWNNESDKELAISTGLYNYTNILLYDAEWDKGGRLFVTTPRTHDANPASLSTVFEEPGEKRVALLQPYPSPEWHVVGNCSGITNALKIVIDKCDYLWIVDSGLIGEEVICPAQILKINVKTDQLVMRYEIPEEVSRRGLLGTHAVKTEGANCEKTLVFAADLRGSGYVIFDGSTAWRLDNDFFKPDANFSDFTVDDWNVNVPYGPIAFTTLDKKFADTERALMWSWSGNHVYGLSILELSSSSQSQENLLWYKSEYEFQSPATTGIISKEGILFTAFIGRPKLSCVWLGNSVTAENVDVLIEESERLPVIAGMKTKTDANGNEVLCIITNNYLRYRAGKTNFREINAGIYTVDIADLTNGTRCQPKADFIPCKSWRERGFTPLENNNGSNL